MTVHACNPSTPLESLGWKGHEFKASWDNTGRLCLKHINNLPLKKERREEGRREIARLAPMRTH